MSGYRLRPMTWTFPSIAVAMNLALFYVMWWATRLSDPEMNPRSISRNGYLMNEVEFGPYETTLTVLVSLGLTALFGAFLYMRRAR